MKITVQEWQVNICVIRYLIGIMTGPQSMLFNFIFSILFYKSQLQKIEVTSFLNLEECHPLRKFCRLGKGMVSGK